MSGAPSVTVVIPAFNAAHCLRDAIASLQKQTLAPAQIVVVDDGSTDATAAVAEQVGAQCLRQSQRGPGAARNRGVAAATGEFVAFLDADDWYAPDKLAHSVAALRELGAQCLATDAWVVRGNVVRGRKNAGRNVPAALTQENLLRGNPIVCSSVVVRRATLEAMGGFDEHPDLIASEDYDLWLRLAQQEPIAYLHEPLTFYRVSGGSLSSNQRFLCGVDRILDKVAAQHAGEAHFLNLVRRRRRDLRLDLAWDLLAAGRFGEARRSLCSAAELGRNRKYWRMWLRCMLRRRPAPMVAE